MPLPSIVFRRAGAPSSAFAVLRALFFIAAFGVGSHAWAVDMLVTNFTDAPDPAVRGGRITYSATITNNAADVAHGVSLVFALDPNTVYVSNDGGCSYASGPHTVTCGYATVNGDTTGPNTADFITVNVVVASTAAAGATIGMTATVSTTDTDTSSGNDSLSQTTTLNDGADLSLSLQPVRSSVTAGGIVSYTASTSNLGPNVAGPVTVTTTLSPNLAYQSASGGGWNCGASGQVVTCTRPSAAVGALPDVTINAKETGAVTGTITTTSVVSITGSATDYNNANDAATANVTVTNGTDLAITKSASTPTPASGQAMSFVLMPRNQGPFAATSVTVTDTVPNGFSAIGASGTGWSCGVSGQTVTCTRASYAVGATNNITVTATAPTVTSNTSFTNTAQIGSATPDPTSSNDSGSVSVVVLPDGVDLSITKTRSPNPVAQGSNITSTIKVASAGPRAAAAGEVTVTDTLPAGESYVGYSGSNWTCGASGSVVTCTYNTGLASGASSSNLVLTSTAVNAGTLTNTACAAYTDTGGHGWVDPVAGNNCASAQVVSTASPGSIDLQLAMTASTDTLAWNAASLDYTLTVTNAGPADATGVVVTDTIPAYVNGKTGVVAALTGGTATASFSCTNGGTVTCTQTGGAIAAGATAVFKITVSRPLYDSSAQSGGKWTNAASVTSTDQGDTDRSNNTASVQVKIDPVSDLRIQHTVTPTTAQAGTSATWVLTVNNDGPSTARSVSVSDVFAISAGTMTFVSAAPSTGSCTAFDTGSNTLSCSFGDMTPGATATVTVVTRPDYMVAPPAPRTVTANATVSATTQDNNTSNNSATATLGVSQASSDLLVNNTDSPDPLGFVPASAGPTFPDNVITYRNVVTNRGPSVASGMVLTYKMTPPAGKQATFLGDKLTAGGQSYANYCDNLNTQVTGPSTLTITCRFPSSFILLANNATTDLYLDFRVDSNPSATGDAFASTVSIAGNEPDSVAGNNTVSQTTTVRMRADLQLAKSARAFVNGSDSATTTAEVRQPFYWVMTLTNAGPGDSQVTQITDTLPGGVTLYTGGTVAPYNAAPYASGVTWVTNNGTPTSGTCSGTTTLTCSIGLLESGKVAIVRVPVVSNTAGVRSNCASASTSEVDPNAGNNTSICSAVTVRESSIAGTVYSDLDNNGTKGGAEPGIGNVAVTLTGTDSYGAAVNATTTTNASGGFSFLHLSSGTYALAEAQPANFQDGKDAAGTSGGTVSGTGAGSDAITAIGLSPNTAATGYLFGELANASLSGYVFVDGNGNAARDAAETVGLAGVTLTLTGTDDLGVVSTTTTSGASGAYSFTGLRPGSYQLVQAPVAGVTHTGMTVGSKGGQDGATVVGANTAVPGADKRTVSAIALVAGDAAQNYSFGESGQILSGSVYVDLNQNGVRDAGEPGIAGVGVTLSGNTASGANVCVAISPNPCTVVTGADGTYTFSGVPASDATGYHVAQQSQASAPLSNYLDGAEHVGTLGGNAATNDRFDGIVLGVGQSGTGYDFGERGVSIGARVYLDRNDNGSADAGEPGVAGVTVKLSGTTVSGADACTLVSSCTVVTGADGTVAFAGLPLPGAAGYTLTETQPADYAERSNTVGSGGGTAASATGTSTFTGIGFGAGTGATGYAFGEKATALTGVVFADTNNNGAPDAGETGIAGVTLTLSGTTASGANVCTLAPSCTAVTAADGSYRFADLPNAGGAGYAVTAQAQATAPLNAYLGGKLAAGTNCGACTAITASPNAFANVPVDAAKPYIGYNFGQLVPAAIAGHIYKDVNGNGTLDPNEALAGVTVSLNGSDDLGHAVGLVAVTGADGAYAFTNLRPSSATGYTLAETQPIGYGDFPGTTGTVVGSIGGVARGVAAANAVGAIVLGAGQSGAGFDFRDKPSSLAGTVYLDLNDNGIADAGELPLAGVAVRLTGTDVDGGAVDLTATTTAAGTFVFSGLKRGSYVLTETQPAGYTDGRETAGSAGGTVNNAVFDATPAANAIAGILLPGGADATGYGFGERAPPLNSSIAGAVFMDADNDGVQTGGERGIPGVTIRLTGLTRRGAPVSLDTLTDGAGHFAFDKLEASGPAGYTLTELQPAAYDDGRTWPGAGNGTSASTKPVAGGGDDTVTGIALGDNAALAGYNFAEFDRAAASVAGHVYKDANANGAMEAGEALAGVTLTVSGLDDVGNPVNRTTVSGADGSYLFGNLRPSSAAGYTVTETQPAGYADFAGASGTIVGRIGTAGTGAAGVGTAAPNAVTAIVVGPGRAATGYDFRDKPASLAGLVYVDANDDGLPQADEALLGGVTVRLTGTDADGGAVDLSTTTANGAYRFDGLKRGTYTLTETQPAGYPDGREAAGSAGGAVNNAVFDATPAANAISAIALPAGVDATGYHFGERRPASGAGIAGSVFADADDDGVRAAGEPGIAGVTVRLTGTSAAGAAVAREAVTDANGRFAFAGLASSDAAGYVLAELQPAGYADGKSIAPAGKGRATSAKPVASGAADVIGAIVLGDDVQLDGYAFAERPVSAAVGGRVFTDANGDGIAQDGEAGIAGVTLQLSGLDRDGNPVSRSAVTGADGRYRFAGLPPSGAAGYRLAELQPGGYADGRTVVAAGNPGAPEGRKPVGVGNQDAVAGIVLAAQELAGYDFAETAIPSLKPPIVNGYVWMDRAHDRRRPVDGSQQGLADWAVQLLRNGSPVCAVRTGADGFYQFDNLHCAGYEATGLPTGAGYSIVFTKDGNKLPAVATSGNAAGVAAPSGGRIDSITLRPDEVVVEQNLPLDPAGIVYDAVTRKPIPGAVVTVSGPAGFDPARHLVGGTAAAAQTTGADGMYQFLLQNGFPSGTYTLAVAAPAGYLPAPSQAIAPCAGTATVGLAPNPALVQASETAPPASVPLHDRAACAGIVAGGARTTQYYLAFGLTNGGSAPVLNNNLPLDPLLADALVLSKTTPLVNVARGDLVPYTITATNNGTVPLRASAVQDLLPPGFQYRAGSARANGVAVTPTAAGRTLSFAARPFAAREKVVYTLVLAVGAGVGEGEYVNRAVAVDAGGAPVSNTASATVRVVPDATFDCPDVIGKVFDDANVNGYQDDGERGLPGVRLATPRGLLVTTDAEGRYHVPCAEIPNADRGANFVMKVDDRTLPSGYRMTTENPGSVRITRGKVAKLNFGAAIHRVVRLELAAAAFADGGAELLPQWNQKLDSMMEQLNAKPSVVRVAYRLDGGDPALAARRADAVRDTIRERWRRQGERYPLAVETEVVQ